MVQLLDAIEGPYTTAHVLPARPTSARPGTPEKVAVMRRRHEDGEHLHHPLDARYAVEGESDEGDGGMNRLSGWSVLLIRARRGSKRTSLMRLEGAV